MKKRLSWFLAGLVLLLLCGVAVSWNLLFPPALSRELARLVPPDPLMFIQGSQLRTHIDYFTRQTEYATLLNSEFLAGLNQTDWWPGFRENFLAFWKSLIIDPLHIVGHETAFVLYAGEIGDVLPRAILIGKSDRVARIAERLMVGYERLTHQIGITFHQKYQQHAVYVLQTPDMLWPLYYTVVGEAGLISTSLSLLYETIDVIQAQTDVPRSNLGKTGPPATVFTQAYSVADADNRILAGYIDSEGLAGECRRNPLLRALGLGQGYTPVQHRPYAVFTVTTRSNELLSHIRWFSTAQASAHVGSELLEQIDDWSAVLPQTVSQPLIVAGNIPRMQEFMRVGQHLFSQWPVLDAAEVEDGVYGERFECVMSDRLFGLIYTLPEMSCLIDTASVRKSQGALDSLVQSLLIDNLPPLVQNRIATSKEAYQETEISNVILNMPFVKQNIVHYAAVSAVAPAGYTIVSNSIPKLKRQLDALATHPEISAYQLDSALFQSGFLAVMSPKLITDVLKNFSQTATFAFAVPPEQQQAVKQALPLFVQGLQLLSRVTVAGEAIEGQLVLDIRLHPQDSVL